MTVTAGRRPACWSTPPASRPTGVAWAATSTVCWARSVGAPTRTSWWSASAPTAERYETASCRTPRSSPAPAAVATARPGWPGSRPACRCWPSRSAPRCCTRRSTPARCGPACPVTVTVHDATFFTEPEHYEKSQAARSSGSAIKTSLRRAARVIVPSKATRDELIRLLDADPTRIDVAYHGVDPDAFHAPSDGREGPGTGPARAGRDALRRVPRAPRSPARTCPT